MRGNVVVGILAVALLTSAPVFAADSESAGFVMHVALPEALPTPEPPQRVLPMLSVTLAGLQAFDVVSTLRALDRGGVEANPVMRGVVDSPFALTAVKAGTTAASIYAAHRLWTTGRRKSAVFLMVATNAMMGVVAIRNASTLRNLQ